MIAERVHWAPRRLAMGCFGAAATVLALASLASACTGIAPNGTGHYLEVTPDNAPQGVATPIAVAGHLLNASEVVPGGPDPADCDFGTNETTHCPGNGSGQLWLSGPLTEGKTPEEIFVYPAVFGVHPTDACPTTSRRDIGGVAWNSIEDALVVSGTGEVPDDLPTDGTIWPQLYRVCADPEPNYLWNYFVVV